MKSPSVPQLYRNRVLASIPADDLKELQRHLYPMVFERNQTLQSPGKPVQTVYFLEDGVCSLVATMENGDSIEVGIIGRDSFVGLPAVLGTVSSPNHGYIQIPGSGYRIEANALINQCSSGSGELQRCLQRGIQGLLTQTAQTAACNRVHELEERLSRWLLMCHDRMETDYLSITHEFLATMLGTRRSTVTVAAGILQRAGLIEYSRGTVRVMSRAGLEEAACECYLMVHEEYIRLGLL